MRISDWSSDVCSSDLRDDHPNIQVGPLRPVAQQDRIPILRRTSPLRATDENRIEIWKTIIDVQKHFNELEMRIRNVAVTVLAAFLAAAGFTTKENIYVTLCVGLVSLGRQCDGARKRRPVRV